MKRTRKTIKHQGMKIRVLGWGRTYSIWLFAQDGRRLERVFIDSGYRSRKAAMIAGRKAVEILQRVAA